MMHEFEHEPRVANVGTVLKVEGGGHGVGRLLMQLLLCLSKITCKWILWRRGS